MQAAEVDQSIGKKRGTFPGLRLPSPPGTGPAPLPADSLSPAGRGQGRVLYPTLLRRRCFWPSSLRPRDAHFPSLTLQSSSWHLVGDQDICAERSWKYQEILQGPDSSLGWRISFKTEKSAFFGVETVTEFILPYTLF